MTVDTSALQPQEDFDEWLLTTEDNPWNPFTHWDEWYTFDESAGHHTCGLVARFSLSTSELSEKDQEFEHRKAIHTILNIFPEGPWKIVRNIKQK